MRSTNEKKIFADKKVATETLVSKRLVFLVFQNAFAALTHNTKRQLKYPKSYYFIKKCKHIFIVTPNTFFKICCNELAQRSVLVIQIRL